MKRSKQRIAKRRDVYGRSGKDVGDRIRTTGDPPSANVTDSFIPETYIAPFKKLTQRCTLSSQDQNVIL